MQGRANLLALREVLPKPQAARVFDTNPRALHAYIVEIRGKVPFAVETASSAEEAIRGADVVVTATSRLEEPVFREA